jgi:hypothetical protein
VESYTQDADDLLAFKPLGAGIQVDKNQATDEAPFMSLQQLSSVNQPIRISIPINAETSSLWDKQDLNIDGCYQGQAAPMNYFESAGKNLYKFTEGGESEAIELDLISSLKEELRNCNCCRIVSANSVEQQVEDVDNDDQEEEEEEDNDLDNNSGSDDDEENDEGVEKISEYQSSVTNPKVESCRRLHDVDASDSVDEMAWTSTDGLDSMSDSVTDADISQDSDDDKGTERIVV